jgi:hypothetical protein
MKFYIVFILALTGCYLVTKYKPVDTIDIDRNTRDLLEREYLDGIKEVNSWTNALPSPTDCDGLVWAGVACAAGADTEINLFQYNAGEWHRRPENACWDGKDVGSKSTISNDGLVALMLCLSVRSDLSNANYLRDYGEGNRWVMGEPLSRPFEVILKPHFVGMLYRMVHAAGGIESAGARIPLVLKYSHDLDYVAHIQILAMLTDLVNTGELNESNIDLIESYRARYPDDYLIAAVSGLYSGKDVSGMLLEQTVTPTYVRGDSFERFRLVHWLLAAKIVLYGVN